jgi:hypothetical protein
VLILLVPGGSLGSFVVGEEGADAGGMMAIEGIVIGAGGEGRFLEFRCARAIFSSSAKSV